MLTLTNIIVFAIGFVVLLVWITLYAKGYKYAHLFESLNEKEFPLKEVYFVGYGFMEIIKYKYNSKADRQLRKELGVLYGTKYVDYYVRIIYSQRITLALTIAVLAFVLYGFTNDTTILIVVLAFSALAYYYFGTVAKKKILKRSEEMLRDFSEVISKLALLTNAGMILREAWEEVSATGESVLYQEMRLATDDMNNGVSEVDALYKFGLRCILPEIKKFTSTLVQGLIKGNAELSLMLKEQSKEVWNMKKQLIKRAGEKAASKLLIPMCIMFIGILVMIILPIFANIGSI